mgnify:CR=1 FL=1
MEAERTLGGLRCRDVLAELDRYVAGELTPEELAAVEIHVSGCENCARFGAAYAGVVTRLRTDTKDRVPEGLTERLMSRWPEP